jgi:hypothetical protein
MKFLSYCMLMAVFGLAQLCAQANPAEVIQKFQDSAQLNDERVKVFLELEAKAELGDLDAIVRVGDYYYSGRFPVTRNSGKAKALWTKGASLGSDQCASFMYSFGFPDSNDTDVIIEKTKWYIIQAQLRRNKYKTPGEPEVRKPNNVSDSSFEEAKLRAGAFLSSVVQSNRNIEKPAVETPVDYKTRVKSERFRLPTFRSAAEANAFRTELLTEFRKVQGPIYHNQVNASDAHAAAYAVVAEKILALQSKGLNISFETSNRGSGYNAASESKITALRSQLRSISIKTQAPFTRQDANNAQVFLDRYRDLLDTIDRGL